MNKGQVVFEELTLTLPVPCISGSCIEITIKILFLNSCCTSKGFMKAFKVFMKPFGAPQRSVKIKV